MMNQKLYDQLEKEFGRNGIHEDVEDVLLELAEAISDREILDKEVVCKESYGRTVIEGRGICTEEDGEWNVKILTVKVGRREFIIEDYFL